MVFRIPKKYRASVKLLTEAHEELDWSDVITIVEGDIFSSVDHLAHCVSMDFEMKSGISEDFKQEFGGVEALFNQRIRPGGVAISSDQMVRGGRMETRYLYYLVVKTKYNDKPSYGILERSLQAMKTHAVEHEVDMICVPKLGGGYDGLHWKKVYELLHWVFESTEIHICVYVPPRIGVVDAAVDDGAKALA